VAPAFAIETGFSYMLCGPERRVAGSDLDDPLGRAARVAQALVADAGARTSWAPR
jgi:hypothetical protein